MIRIFCALIGYLIGNFQTGFLYGKLQHIDIRMYGSGNAGTNNALRVMGIKAGVVTFLGDLGKMLLAVLICHLIFGRGHTERRMLILIYTALGVIIGHDYPFFMKFKGGKGIASFGGLCLLLGGPYPIVCAIVFFGLILLTGYVSLASCTMSVVIGLMYLALGLSGHTDFGVMAPWEGYLIMLFICGLALYRHRSNIHRLLTHTESKISFKK